METVVGEPHVAPPQRPAVVVAPASGVEQRLTRTCPLRQHLDRLGGAGHLVGLPPAAAAIQVEDPAVVRPRVPEWMGRVFYAHLTAYTRSEEHTSELQSPCN